MKTNNELFERFSRLYKGCTLYAIHLDGFSHTVFYKDSLGTKHIDSMSAYAPEQYTPAKASGTGIRSFNEDKTKVLFIGYPHCSYQNNAQEYIYKDVEEW